MAQRPALVTEQIGGAPTVVVPPQEALELPRLRFFFFLLACT